MQGHPVVVSDELGPERQAEAGQTESVQGAFQAEEQIRERARGEVEEKAQSLVAEWWAKDRV